MPGSRTSPCRARPSPSTPIDDPGDPTAVVIETITAELFLTEPGEVAPYEHLFARLRKAALPEEESLDLITKTAADLPDG